MKKVITLIFLATIIAIGSDSEAQVLMQKKHHQKVLSNSAKKSKSNLKVFNKSLNQLPTKIENYGWDTTSTSWLKEYESVVSYNSNNLPVLEMMYDLNGNEAFRAISTYDSKNRLTQYLTEYKGQNNSWIGNEKYIYVYNADDELILSEESYYTGASWEVFYGTKKDIVKNTSTNTKTTITLENYGSAYDTIDKLIQYYSPNNLLISEQSFQYSFVGGFQPTEQYEYLYDQNNVDTGMIKSTWDGSDWDAQFLYCNYTWDNPSKDFLAGNKIYFYTSTGLHIYQRETYTRDANGSFSYLLEEEANGQWFGNMKINIVHDNYKNRVLYDYDVNYGNGWLDLFMIVEEYTYDATGNMTSHIYKETDFNGDLQNKYKLVFSEFINATGLNNTKYLEVKIYPNPCTEFIKVEHANLNEKEYVIYNLGGQIIQRGTIQQQKINTTELSNGYYILNTEKYQAVFIKK